MEREEEHRWIMDHGARDADFLPREKENTLCHASDTTRFQSEHAISPRVFSSFYLFIEFLHR